MAEPRKRGPDPRRGVYVPVLPLDVLMMKLMPKQGTTFMGVYPEGASLKDIQKVIADGKIPSSVLGTRLRVLHQFGFAVAVAVPRQTTRGWQVTPKGMQLIAEHEPREADGGDTGTTSAG